MIRKEAAKLAEKRDQSYLTHAYSGMAFAFALYEIVTSTTATNKQTLCKNQFCSGS